MKNSTSGVALFHRKMDGRCEVAATKNRPQRQLDLHRTSQARRLRFIIRQAASYDTAVFAFKIMQFL
ncbi:hypothetical protein [Cohnella sp.]|uniref:hypothetical protein n=1 Tax=Cohnella sp. TaxID=1883426 RepID=UPI003564504A